MIYRFLLISLFASFALAGCGGKKYTTDLDELSYQRSVWSSKQPEKYSYTIDIGCFCPHEADRRITVDGDVATVQGVPPLRGHFQGNVRENYGEPMTMDALFDIIENAFAVGYDGIDVEYHPEYGYPEVIHLDRYAGAVDDEVSYFVKDFAVSDTPVFDFYEAWIQWGDSGLDDYYYTLSRDCFCIFAGDFELAVINGAIDSLYADQEMRYLEQSEFSTLSWTVPQLFAVIYSSIAEGSNVDAIYDESLGYPIRIAIDEELLPVDAGLIYQINGFTADVKKVDKPVTIEQLESQKSIWRNVNKSGLAYSYQQICLCEEDDYYYRLSLSGVQVADVTLYQFPQVSDLDLTYQPLSVDALFDEAERIILGGADRIDIDFHPQMGFPIFIKEDLDAGEQGDELVIRVFEITDGNSPIDELYNRVAIWNASEIENYDFTYTWNYPSRSLGEFEIVVEAGEPVNGKELTEDRELPLDEFQDVDGTISALFDTLRYYLDHEETVASVVYDETYGYPEQLYLTSPKHLEGGYSIQVTEFSLP